MSYMFSYGRMCYYSVIIFIMCMYDVDIKIGLVESVEAEGY